MKKIGYILVAFALFSACSPSPEKVKEKCLKDKNNQVFYGEQTPAYCDCMYNKLTEIADSVKLTDEVIDSVKTECDAEFTSFDTNF